MKGKRQGHTIVFFLFSQLPHVPSSDILSANNFTEVWHNCWAPVGCLQVWGSGRKPGEKLQGKNAGFFSPLLFSVNVCKKKLVSLKKKIKGNIFHIEKAISLGRNSKRTSSVFFLKDVAAEHQAINNLSIKLSLLCDVTALKSLQFWIVKIILLLRSNGLVLCSVSNTKPSSCTCSWSKAEY